MKNKERLFGYLLLLVAAISTVSMIVVLTSQVNDQKISDEVTANILSEMSGQAIELEDLAKEIAKLVVVDPVVDPKVQDLWNDLHAEEIEELEDEAHDASLEELEKRDYQVLEKYLKRTVDGFDELKKVTIKDYEVNVIQLGLEDEENKRATVEFEVEVRYSLEQGIIQNYKEILCVESYVIFDEGDFDEETVEFLIQ